jgi:imidazolonepropionase-like amidohydrolase
MEGEVGQVTPGGSADLLVLDGSPLENIRVLAAPQQYLKLVMARGDIIMDSIAS